MMISNQTDYINIFFLYEGEQHKSQNNNKKFSIPKSFKKSKFEILGCFISLKLQFEIRIFKKKSQRFKRSNIRSFGFFKGTFVIRLKHSMIVVLGFLKVDL